MTTSTIESTFLAAVKAGPVLLLDNMGDRTHAATNDPLTSNSPLIRLAILAVDLGADPELLCFNKHQRLAGMTERQCSEVSAVMYNVGADCDDLTRALKYDVPTIGFHYCSLNAMYFVDEFGAYGQRLKAHRPKEDNENVQVPLVWFEPMPARVDFANAKHLRVLERIHMHFTSQGWTTAAERLENCKGAGQVVVEAVADAMATGTPPATAAGGDPEPTRSTVMRAAMFLVRYGRMSLRPVAEGTTLAHAENQAKPFTEFGDLPSEVKRGRILTASELLQKIEITGITDDSTGALDAVQVEWLAELIHTSEKAAVEAGLVAVKLDPPRPWIEFADLPELAQQGRERQASFLLQRFKIEPRRISASAFPDGWDLAQQCEAMVEVLDRMLADKNIAMRELRDQPERWMHELTLALLALRGAAEQSQGLGLLKAQVEAVLNDGAPEDEELQARIAEKDTPATAARLLALGQNRGAFAVLDEGESSNEQDGGLSGISTDSILALAHALWQLLDDVDTADDMAKEDDKLFRGMAMQAARRREMYFASPDGKSLLPTLPAERPQISERIKQWEEKLATDAKSTFVKPTAEKGGRSVEDLRAAGILGPDRLTVNRRRRPSVHGGMNRPDMYMKQLAAMAAWLDAEGDDYGGTYARELADRLNTRHEGVLDVTTPTWLGTGDALDVEPAIRCHPEVGCVFQGDDGPYLTIDPMDGGDVSIVHMGDVVRWMEARLGAVADTAAKGDAEREDYDATVGSGYEGEAIDAEFEETPDEVVAAQEAADPFNIDPPPGYGDADPYSEVAAVETAAAADDDSDRDVEHELDAQADGEDDL